MLRGAVDKNLGMGLPGSSLAVSIIDDPLPGVLAMRERQSPPPGPAMDAGALGAIGALGTIGALGAVGAAGDVIEIPTGASLAVIAAALVLSITASIKWPGSGGTTRPA